MTAVASAPTIPMTVIGGFLGTGKTTLLNRLLRGNHGIRFAVMINDFGDLAIDDSLVERHGGNTLTFANGCVCCTLGDNFMRSLDGLLKVERPPQQILVEASGVADPQSIADIAVLHPPLRRDLVIVLAAADSIRERAADELTGDTVQRQLAAADLIVLNKIDLVDGDKRSSLQRWIADQYPVAVFATQDASVPMDLLAAGTGSLSGDHCKSLTAELIAHPHHHDNFVAVTLSVSQPLDPEQLQCRLAALPSSVLRVKGFFRASVSGQPCYLVQCSGRQVQLSQWHPASAPAALVVIGTRNMPDAGELAVRLGIHQDAVQE